MSSLRNNILANYASQIYVTLIGIIMVPIYVKYMGAEAYGLVGFFAMLQAWFQLLDVGLTPTMVRETARFRGGAIGASEFRRFVRALEGIFLFVAITAGLSLFAAAEHIATGWLQAAQLPVAEVEKSVQLMALIIALRWMEGLYRGAITGSERFQWMAKFNSIIATGRFIVVIPVLIFIGATPSIFFHFQLYVAIIEFLVLISFSYKILPKLPKGEKLAWAWAPLKPVLKFSLAIAFTSSIWIFSTQLDKLVLSKVLPLAEYGYFSLAVLLAGGILIISAPISNALLPRLTKLEAEGNHHGLIQTYRQATQMVSVFAGSVAFTLAFCAEPLLSAWSGDPTLASHVAPALRLYALGNGILAVAGFPYFLQYAKGDLRLHLIGSGLFVVVLIPAVLWAATRSGGVGAGFVWLGLNLVLYSLWIPIVHRKFDLKLNTKWYQEDTLPIFICQAAMIMAATNFIPAPNNRLLQFAYVLTFGLATLLAGATASSVVRMKFKTWRNSDIQS